MTAAGLDAATGDDGLADSKKVDDKKLFDLNAIKRLPKNFWLL